MNTAKILVQFAQPIAFRVAVMPISARTVLVDTNAVRIARGVSADQVKAWTEEGKLLWVFNLGRPESTMQDLRFWLPEVLDPKAVATLCLDDVIAKILPPSRQAYNGSEIGQWLLVSRPTVKRIGAKCSGSIVNKRFLSVPREPLAGYLRQCWIGGGK